MKKIIWNCALWFSLFILAQSFTAQPAYSDSYDTPLAWPSTFEERKAKYIQDVMANLNNEGICQRNHLWAFLDDAAPDSQRLRDIVHLTMRAMVMGWESVYGTEPDLMQECLCEGLAGYNPDGSYNGYDDDSTGFGKSIWVDNLLVPKVLIKYPHLIGTKIRKEDYDFIKNSMRNSITSGGIFISANGNQQIGVMAGVYLYTYYFDRNLELTFNGCEGDSTDCRWPDFSYSGRSYIRGNKYNAYQFARDWLGYTLNKFYDTHYYDKYTRMAYYFEWDGGYTHAYINALNNLYDLAEDPEIKTKAKMALDLFLLDALMDTNGMPYYISQGGARGRSGEKGLSAYEYILFGFPRSMHPAYPERNLYFSSYRPPDVIYDAIVLDDEPIGIGGDTETIRNG